MVHLIQTATRSAVLASLALTVLAAVPASGVTIFSTTLNSLNERPVPVESPGSGTGLLTLATDQNRFTVQLNYSNLSSNAVAAHVHCCSTAAASAPVAIGFTVPGGLTGIVTGTFDLTQASTYTAAFLTANGGTAASARSTFVTGLNGGLAYFNVHTQSNPGGEIRGQLSAAGAVPEPASWALMITGFALVGGTLRRRTNAAA